MDNQQQSDFKRFSSFGALYDGSYRVCKDVGWKDSTITLQESRIETVIETEEELQAELYRQLVFSCFSIIERGKPRDIRACHIKDRMVQSALCEEVLLPELTPKLIYDNCATLKDKGIDFALKRAKYHLQAAHREYGLGKPFECFRGDIKKYFDSIDHEELKKLCRYLIKDKQVAELVCYLIDTFEFRPTKDETPQPGKDYYVVKGQKYVRVENLKSFKPGCKYYECIPKSLGLGSQVSQLLALLTLNELDHYIKEKLHIKHYGRYMDDFFLFHNDRAYLQYCKKEIEEHLRKMGLSLNQNKSVIFTIIPDDNVRHTPFKYLKWNFYLTTTNHVIMLPFRKKINNEKRKLRKMHQAWLEGRITTEAIQQSYDGWREHMSHGSTYYILQDMDNMVRRLFKGEVKV